MLNKILLQIAKDSILSKFDVNYAPKRDDVVKNHPFLLEKRATFVTLHYDKNLRGCIGSLIAHRTLFDDISSNAISAAFKDTRFMPLEERELSHLTMEVSVLSIPKLLEYKDFNDLVSKIQVNTDGLILKHGGYHGTFLPQVWKQLSNPKIFLEHLSMKAGANPSIFNEHPQIYTYQVKAIEEKFDDIPSLQR